MLEGSGGVRLFFLYGEVWIVDLMRYLLQVVAGMRCSFVGCLGWLGCNVSALDVLLFAHAPLVPMSVRWSIQLRFDMMMQYRNFHQFIVLIISEAAGSLKRTGPPISPKTSNFPSPIISTPKSNFPSFAKHLRSTQYKFHNT